MNKTTSYDIIANNDNNDNLESPLRNDNEWNETLDCYSAFNNDIINPAECLNDDIENNPLNILRGLLEVPLLLVLIGIITALFSFIIIICVKYGNNLLIYLMNCFTPSYHLIIFSMWSCTMAMISVFIVQNICEESAGGGLSEMKAILSGLIKPVLLSKRLIIAKTLGLIAALLAQLSIGKEGPLVLIAAGLSDQIMRTRAFLHLRRQDNKRIEILACACAAGVGTHNNN